jgi:hypothetical protein
MEPRLEARLRQVRCGNLTRPKSLAAFDVEWLTDVELRKRLPTLVRAIAEDIRGKPFPD